MLAMLVSRVRQEWIGLPRLMRWGLALLVASAVVDAGTHVAPATWLPMIDRYVGHDAMFVHWTMFIGMLIILLAVFTAGIQQARRARRQAMQRVEVETPFKRG